MLLAMAAFILALQGSLFQVGKLTKGRGEMTGTIGKSLSKLSADFCGFTSEKVKKAVAWGLARGAERQDKCVEVGCSYMAV